MNTNELSSLADMRITDAETEYAVMDAASTMGPDPEACISASFAAIRARYPDDGILRILTSGIEHFHIPNLVDLRLDEADPGQ